MLSFAVIVAASGWLYIVQPHSSVPGPPVPDALPLDELSRRSAVPLLVFLGIWAGAAISLGLITRIMRAERLTAGLMLALAVGGWGYLQTGLSLLIVRQIPAHQAFHAAAGQKAIYLPATLAGLAGALGGRARRTERARSPLVLAWFVAAAGMLGVIDAVTPDQRSTLIAALAPENVHGVSEALVAPLGLLLLVSARGLARRKHRAWQVAVVVLLWLVALHLQHRFGYGAVATGLVGVALLARRADFDAQGDPSANPRIALRALLFGSSIFGYAFIALWLNRVMVDQPFTLSFALHEIARDAVGANAVGSHHLAGSFGEWFPLSVLLLTVCAAVLLVLAWLAPWRYRHAQETRHRRLTRDLVATWGVDTLAPFVLRADKSYFFDEEEAAFLAYKVVGGVAIVSGDPIGPRERFPDLVGSFLGFARARGWRVAILGVSEGALDLYRGHGLHALYHGDEAVVETSTFSLEGRPIRKVRQSVHRLERSGYTATATRPSELGTQLRHELESLARDWRGAQPERGFVMALDTLFRLDDEHALFVIGRAPDGSVAGFLHFAVCRRGSALSLSSMPRLRTTPNGFNEWLVCVAIDWARDESIERVSLNFAPFAALLAPEAELSALQRLERRALLRLKGHFQLDNLLLFNRKFLPEWQRRFVVYEKRLDLPRVGIAALAAEAYLPFTGKDRR
ncbi:MAG TPA: phosphatidylglycerol lysyltransferase domain-containing protein [Gaiellaceae bacterium]|nr:phosphatidylglycerol lysyltransferase domain-containing protein [Gaiellaceae bacterium]